MSAVSGSAIYEGRISHRRRRPVDHDFSYPILMLLLDLDELPEALDRHPLFSARRPAPVRFRCEDYLGADEARDLVGERTGSRPGGPVRLLTTPRIFGFGFNPVSFFYLYGKKGEEVEAVIAEVTNTPWGKRHHYVLSATVGGGPIEGRLEKRLHVSPFMPMDQVYEWSATQPGDRLHVRITNSEAGERVFDAGLELRRRPLERAQMTRAILRHPPQAAATLARIYWNAVKLKVKGAPYFSPPKPAARGSEGATG